MKARVIVEMDDHRDVIFVATSVETSQTNEIEEVTGSGPTKDHRLTGRRFLTVNAEFDPADVDRTTEPDIDIARVDRTTGNMRWSKGDEERLKTRVKRVVP